MWLRVSLLSFGGPAGQIAVMHRIIVDEKKWSPKDVSISGQSLRRRGQRPVAAGTAAGRRRGRPSFSTSQRIAT